MPVQNKSSVTHPPPPPQRTCTHIHTLQNPSVLQQSYTHFEKLCFSLECSMFNQLIYDPVDDAQNNVFIIPEL